MISIWLWELFLIVHWLYWLNSTQKQGIGTIQMSDPKQFLHLFWAEDHQRLPEVSVLKPERIDIPHDSTPWHCLKCVYHLIISHQNWFKMIQNVLRCHFPHDLPAFYQPFVSLFGSPCDPGGQLGPCQAPSPLPGPKCAAPGRRAGCEPTLGRERLPGYPVNISMKIWG